MVTKVIETAKAFMLNELGLEATVVGVEETPEGWIALAEAVVVDMYLRRFAKKDLVETFELRITENYEVKSFLRKGMRERGSVAE